MTIIIARRSERSIATILGLLATTVMSVIRDRSQYEAVFYFWHLRLAMGNLQHVLYLGTPNYLI